MQRGRRSGIAFGLIAGLLLAAGGIGVASAGAVRLLDAGELEGRVLDLADERLALMPEIACAKRRAGLPVVDVAREAAVVAAVARQADAVGFEPAPIEQAMRVQIALAREAQERAASEPPANCAGLDALRERLDRWTPEFVRALHLAAGALAAPDATRTLAALAAERLRAPRWSESGRQALIAALVQIRRRDAPTLARARAAGVLRIGTPGDYAPFAVERDGWLRGADVELARALAAALGLEPVYVRTSWRTLVEDLRADRFDVAVGGISVTPDREAAGDFARAHGRGGKTAIGRCADARRLRSLATIDRDGVRVIVNPGGTNERFVRERIRHASVRVHPDNRTIFDELVAGRADAMFTDDTEVALQTRRHRELCRLVRDTWLPAEKAMLLQPDGGWREAVDAWLVLAIRDGLPRRLLDAELAR